ASTDPETCRHSLRSRVSATAECIAHAPFIGARIAHDQPIADAQVVRQIQAGGENVILHADAAEDAYRATGDRYHAMISEAKKTMGIHGDERQLGEAGIHDDLVQRALMAAH